MLFYYISRPADNLYKDYKFQLSVMVIKSYLLATRKSNLVQINPIPSRPNALCALLPVHLYFSQPLYLSPNNFIFCAKNHPQILPHKLDEIKLNVSTFISVKVKSNELGSPLFTAFLMFMSGQELSLFY